MTAAAVYSVTDPADEPSGSTAVIVVSPAEGVTPSATVGAGEAGSYAPASVIGTGANADLVVYGAEAV